MGGASGHNHTHLVVFMSHAIADAYAIVPLMNDLWRLYAEESAAGTGMGGVQEPWAKLPHFGEILDERLTQSLRGDGMHLDTMFFDRRSNFLTYYLDRWNGYKQCLHLGVVEMTELQRIADIHFHTCPAHVAIIALVVLVLARLRKEPFMRFTIVHHCRDSPPGAESIVGFFTDFRTVCVPTSELASVLGVFTCIRHAIQDRSWRRPEITEDLQLLINVVPSIFDKVGPFDQVTPPAEVNVDNPFWQYEQTKRLQYPAELQIEQAAPLEWDLYMWLDESIYPRVKGRAFQEEWATAVGQLSDDPSAPCQK